MIVTLPDAFYLAIVAGILGGVVGGTVVTVYLRYVHPKPRAPRFIGDANLDPAPKR